MQGMQCYLKNSEFGECLGDCNPDWGWNCTRFGPRAPQKTPCSWPGEDCSKTKGCNGYFNQCMRKDEKTAYCVTPESDHPDWSNEVLGHACGDYVVSPQPEGSQSVAGTSLFCFMAVLPKSHEGELLTQAKSCKGSIFSCDAHAVYDSAPADAIHGMDWGSFKNALQFIEVWKGVFKMGLYKNYDWTVKVDPDAVFIPWRLVEHLDKLRPPADKPIYIKNSDTAFEFMGAIEVLSKVAMDSFALSYQDCQRTLPGKTNAENGWLKSCLDAIGAGYMKDVDLLSAPDEPKCTSAKRVVFHPRKDAVAWGSCWDSATSGRP